MKEGVRDKETSIERKKRRNKLSKKDREKRGIMKEMMACKEKKTHEGGKLSEKSLKSKKGGKRNLVEKQG